MLQQPVQRHRQLGAVLPISMLILLILTIVGVASMQSAMYEERKTGNMYDQNVAFQSGEAALREAEVNLVKAIPEVMGLKINNIRDFETGKTGLYHLQTNISSLPKTQDLDATRNAVAATSVIAETKNAPVFTVTYMGGVNGNSPAMGNASEPNVDTRLMDVIRITTRSHGNSQQTRVVLETQVGIEPIPE